jgi:IS605 OrfB family transposase
MKASPDGKLADHRRCAQGPSPEGDGGKRRSRRQASQAIANWRRVHKVSRRIVNRFGRIGVEGFERKRLGCWNVRQAREDAAWAQLVSMINYKAINAGGEVIYVDPRAVRVRNALNADKLGRSRSGSCDGGAVPKCARIIRRQNVVHFRAFGFRARNGLPVLCEAAAS